MKKDDVMKKKVLFQCLMALAVFLTWRLHPAMAQENKKFKVLVVMSYDDAYPWVQEIKEGIDSVLEKTCDLKYFYLDTKRNLKGGEQKAKEAYALYQEFSPDGVITADDNAQTMFVIPYLKDKVKTPVMFCGVNAKPEKYGYPASNVSGILERLHVRESVAFAQQLVPSIKTFGFMMGDNPESLAARGQIEDESDTYPANFAGFKTAKTLKELVAITNDFKGKCDALFIASMHGAIDDNGKFLTDKEIIPVLVKTFGKPTISANLYHVKNGILCSVVKMGQEQGETAAKMLLDAMNGTPVSQIPITKNEKGKRILNVTVLKELGIKPQANALAKTEIVQTEE